MVKEKTNCPVCKDPIVHHDTFKALECFNEAGISKEPIELKDVMAIGYALGGLKGTGQLHGDKNIITMNFGGKPIETITPNLLILQKCLLSKVKKEKKSDEESKSIIGKSSKDSGDSKGSAS